MTTTYLVRHARAVAWSGIDDRPLSEQGLETAAVLGGVLGALPISAIYSSPLRRSLETVTPLAERLGTGVTLVRDLRERELPVVPDTEFARFIERLFRSPETPIDGAEPYAGARARGLSALRTIVDRHPGEHVVLGTHGNLLTLIVTGLDPTRGYEFWRRLSFPDVYRLEFEGTALSGIERIWKDAAGYTA